MRKAILGVLTVLFAVAPTAQTQPPPPGTSFDLLAADVQAVLKAHPGQRGTRVKSVDAGKHVIQFWVDQVQDGAGEGNGGTAHADVTEIYIIVEGSATLVSGGKLINPKSSVGIDSVRTFSGQYEGGVTRKVRAGDIVVNPPGTVHSWKSIESPRLVYVNTWIDPTHTLKAGYVDSALKK